MLNNLRSKISLRPTIKLKILLVGMIGLACFFSFLVYTYNNSIEREHQLNALKESEITALRILKEIWIDSLTIEELITSAMGTSEPDLIDVTEENADRLSYLFAQMKDIAPAFSAKTHELEMNFHDYYTVSTRLASGVINEEYEVDILLDLANKKEKSKELYKSKLDEYDEAIKLSITTEIQSIISDAKQTILNGLTLGVIFTSILVSISILIANMVSRNINKVTNSLKHMSEGHGDLTMRLECNTRDEINDLAKYFNRFMDNLDQTMSELSNISKMFGTEAREIQCQNTETNSAIQHLVGQTDSLVNILDDIFVSVNEVSDASHEALQRSSETNQYASEGQAVIANLLDTVNQNVNDIDKANSIVKKLADHTHNIGSILDMIDKVAEQTNLLALNAAIEAARAGEQGRGFAVVADEVRTLAKRTRESTNQVHEYINVFRKDSELAVHEMEESHHQAATNLERAERAGTTLSMITDAIRVINESNQKIESATVNQNSMINSLKDHVSEINDDAHRTAYSSLQRTSNSGDLSQYSMNLSALISRFTKEACEEQAGDNNFNSDIGSDIELF